VRTIAATARRGKIRERTLRLPDLERVGERRTAFLKEWGRVNVLVLVVRSSV
jgi:hypothetical protein